MWEFLSRLFDTSDFPPRWNCGNWSAGHGWLHIASDLAVWGAYLAIPCVLAYSAARRRDLPFRKIVWLFGAFILACGTTHLMEATIFWWPAYRLTGVIKLVTALVSWATVFALVPITPQILALRSPRELEREIAERQRVEAELRTTHAELEDRVAERMEQLSQANAALKAEIAVRKQVEQALEYERGLFEVTLTSIGDAVVVTDTEGRVIFLNHAAWDMIGCQNDVSGQALNEICNLVDERTGQPSPDLIGRVVATGAVQESNSDCLLTPVHGSPRPIDNRAAPIRNEEGRVMGVVLVFHDITERRRAAEALEQANRNKDAFLAVLGHELRNLLAGIAGAAQVLQSVGSADADTAEMYAIILRQTKHLSRVIDDLLDVSRISRGKLELRLAPLDLTELVRATVEDLRRGLQADDLKLILNLPQERVWVHGDPTRLAQVLVNLLHNAAKFSDPGGTVTVKLQPAAADHYAELSVMDEGVGMDASMLTRIFEPFRQADQEADRGQGGLGLGLTLVKGLVEIHGGQVVARSPGLGQGSEFLLRLPLTEAPAQANRQTQENVHNDHRYRILIIDDSRDAAYPLQVLLARLGHEVRVAPDGRSGLAIAREFSPDLVLCDIGLPGGMDGFAVAAALRADPTTQHACLVAVTGYGQDSDRRRTAEAGFQQHLIKPVHLGDLKSLLAHLAERQVEATESRLV